jgi:mRNA interferase HigB
VRDRRVLTVRIIARKTRKQFVERLRATKIKGPSNRLWIPGFTADVVKTFVNGSVVGSDRVVSNIKGNDYRLVVAINYGLHIIFIKWIGSHADYEIDVKTVPYEY